MFSMSRSFFRVSYPLSVRPSLCLCFVSLRPCLSVSVSVRFFLCVVVLLGLLFVWWEGEGCVVWCGVVCGLVQACVCVRVGS